MPTELPFKPKHTLKKTKSGTPQGAAFHTGLIYLLGIHVHDSLVKFLLA